MMLPSNPSPGGYRPPPGVLLLDRPTISDHPVHCQDNLNSSYFGDRIATKRPLTFRGATCQLGCLPLHPQDAKHEALIHALSSHDIDAIALQELGINFSRARPDSQWKNRIGWNTWLDGNSSKTINAWNRNFQSPHLRQWGGTAILATGPTTAYAAGAGCDPTNLGRWC